MVLEEFTTELGSDEHGFIIEGAVPSGSAPLQENTLVDYWRGEEDPAFSRILVKTGSQWGPFGVVMQVLDADPGPLEERWQDAVAVSVRVDGEVLLGEIVDGPVGGVTPPPGSYRLRVAALGRTQSAERDASFVDDEDEDEEVALEHYLVALWPAPSAAAEVLRQDSQYAQHELSPPAPETTAEQERGLDAARAIVQSLRGDDDSALPGELSDLEVDVVVHGTATRVFNRVQHVFGWPPAQGGMSGPDPMSPTYHDATVPDQPAHGYEQVGFVTTTAVELTKPSRVVKRWNWLLDGPGSVLERPVLLADDSIVTITLEQLDGAESPQTRVRLKQTGVPAAWADHLGPLWEWHITWAASR